MMLQTLQKQQEQINQFMKNTTIDLKQMEQQITQQNDAAQRIVADKNPLNPNKIDDLAQAIYDKQKEDKLKRSIQRLDQKLQGGSQEKNVGMDKENQIGYSNRINNNADLAQELYAGPAMPAQVSGEYQYQANHPSNMANRAQFFNVRNQGQNVQQVGAGAGGVQPPPSSAFSHP